MIDGSPEKTNTPPDSESAGPESPPPGQDAAPYERRPFWGYSDVAVFVGLLFGSFILSLGLVSAAAAVFGVSARNGVIGPIAIQSVAYVLTFCALAFLFRVQYRQPFWRSLGWTSFRLSPAIIVASGLLTAFGVAILSVAIQTPATSNRITEMLENPKNVALVAIFGLTLGPLAEELIFRGFLQPLLVRSLGAVPGVFAAAIPFGLLHFSEYGNSWRHVLLIALAGAAFGWMRQRTGSTKSSTLMHASYNALEFIAYFAQQKEGASR